MAAAADILQSAVLSKFAGKNGTRCQTDQSDLQKVVVLYLTESRVILKGAVSMRGVYLSYLPSSAGGGKKKLVPRIEDHVSLPCV